jgi:hypothetical protein
VITYKLFRVRKDGTIGSLFINRKDKLPLNKWLKAKNHPTKGFAERPFWHCTSKPKAPHLSMKGRKWYRVEIKSYTELKRPKNQGGIWYLAKQIRILEAA